MPDLDSVAGGRLAGDEAAHLLRVLRLGVDDEVEVFDGRGTACRARITATTRDTAQLVVVGVAAAAPEPRVAVTLVMSVLKSDKMDDVVRDAVMMGVQAIQPLVATRSEVSLSALQRGQRVARWERIAVSSAKQSGRAVVPPVLEPMTCAQWMATPATLPTLVLAEPAIAGRHALETIPPLPAVNVAVGPEGGWTDDEMRALIDRGAVAIALGPRTLRADAVPLVALAALYETWRGW